MKKSILISLLTILVITFSSLLFNACSMSKKVSDKSGAQLWGENCARCHNAPSPGEFNNDNWEIVGQHMRVRANLIQPDIYKIVGFLKSANQ